MYASGPFQTPTAISVTVLVQLLVTACYSAGFYSAGPCLYFIGDIQKTCEVF